ncbi:hypothetical protein, partial [Salmonella sp. SAL4360]|uniref:hypothetical protein n=1 Tax=Salmonella sp. SAL4360 TaxID=3159881 RepID=UPI00397C5A27
MDVVSALRRRMSDPPRAPRVRRTIRRVARALNKKNGSHRSDCRFAFKIERAIRLALADQALSRLR